MRSVPSSRHSSKRARARDQAAHSELTEPVTRRRVARSTRCSMRMELQHNWLDGGQLAVQVVMVPVKCRYALPAAATRNRQSQRHRSKQCVEGLRPHVARRPPSTTGYHLCGGSRTRTTWQEADALPGHPLNLGSQYQCRTESGNSTVGAWGVETALGSLAVNRGFRPREDGANAYRCMRRAGECSCLYRPHAVGIATAANAFAVVVALAW